MYDMHDEYDVIAKVLEDVLTPLAQLRRGYQIRQDD